MPDRFDVAIVGCGPSGAALANLLGQAGLAVVVLEREAGVYPLPRAIHFDGEVMRVFHAMGLKAEAESVSRPGHKGMHFVNSEGQTLLIRGGASLDGPHGCANNHYFHQPELERVLRQGLARFPQVRLLTRHEVFAIREAPDEVTLSVENMADGSLFDLRARYVIGCDGARSLVRRLIGSRMEDLGLHQAWLVFDAMLKREVDSLPDNTVQYCDPARPMTYCNVLGPRRRWEIMLMPGDDPVAIARPEHVWRLVSRWITPDDAELERAAVYTFHSVIAKSWRRGRLLIAGDAAHQTPPFLGQGMCAGIRDAANLAWKLVMVLRGQAGDDLLDTYESERSPHVRAFIDLAVRLGDVIQTTNPEVAQARDRKFQAGSPEIFEFPAPGIGPGVRMEGAAPIGQPFPQPLLSDGRLLDQVSSARFVVLGTPAMLAAVNPATGARWLALDAAVIDDDGPAIRDWFARHDALAVVLRPDRYIVGIARDAAELQRSSLCLPRAA